MKLVVASNNPGKVKEIKEILKGHFDDVLSLREAGLEIEVEETGATFFDNALLKARAAAALTSCAVLSDDSGLEVDALNGAPGVYSARYAESGTDADNNLKLLQALTGAENRKANFRSVVVLLTNGTVKTGEGICNGEILRKARGTGGFGYDPLFFSGDLGKSFGEATEEEKNRVSHRKRALTDLLGKLL